jgi:hypothetical protein
MNELKTINENKRKGIRLLAVTGLSLALLLAMQMLGLPNLVTGVAVNGIFIFVLFYAGLKAAIFLCVLSPIGGLVTGHLPPIMYPLVPVIVVGNLFFVVFFFRFLRFSRFFRTLLAATAKSLFIFFAGSGVLSLLNLTDKVKWLIVPILGIQFFTAFAGAMLGEKLYEAIEADFQDSCEPS